MALFSRPGAEAEAMYARILDGRHLWLAVRGEGPLALRSTAGDDLDVPTEERHGLLTAIVPVAQIEGDMTLVAGPGRKAAPVRHVAPAPGSAVTHDGRTGVVVESVDGMVVVRRQPARGIEVSELASVDGGVAVGLSTVEDSGPRGSVSLVVKDQPVAELAVDGDRFVLGVLPTLPPATTATLRVGDRPVVRRGNVLSRPNYAVLLPPMLEPDVELRWLKDGRLAVHRTDRSAP